VVLARGSWWCGSTWSELPTVEAVGGGGGARRDKTSVEIEEEQWVVEHEQVTGKLV
jgi:hypothetical protein